MTVHKDDTAKWDWGNGTAEAKVEKTSTKKTEITTKGKKISRNGTKDNPAVVLKQDDGTKVIKKESELK